MSADACTSMMLLDTLPTEPLDVRVKTDSPSMTMHELLMKMSNRPVVQSSSGGLPMTANVLPKELPMKAYRVHHESIEDSIKSVFNSQHAREQPVNTGQLRRPASTVNIGPIMYTPAEIAMSMNRLTEVTCNRRVIPNRLLFRTERELFNFILRDNIVGTRAELVEIIIALEIFRRGPVNAADMVAERLRYYKTDNLAYTLEDISCSELCNIVVRLIGLYPTYALKAYYYIEAKFYGLWM